MQKFLPVNETFISVQGEGTNSGKLAFFIRFGKCNIKCTFCDTKDAWTDYQLVPEKMLFKLLKKNRSKTSFLILTGGEPCLHDLSNIVNYAKKIGYYIALETNGSIYQKWIKKVDFISLSPKNENIKKEILKLSDELKFVITGKESFKLVEKFIKTGKILFLQPEDNKTCLAELILNKIKKSKYKNYLRLGIQLHKAFGLK